MLKKKENSCRKTPRSWRWKFTHTHTHANQPACHLGVRTNKEHKSQQIFLCPSVAFVIFSNSLFLIFLIYLPPHNLHPPRHLRDKQFKEFSATFLNIFQCFFKDFCVFFPCFIVVQFGLVRFGWVFRIFFFISMCVWVYTKRGWYVWRFAWLAQKRIFFLSLWDGVFVTLYFCCKRNNRWVPPVL